MRGYGNPAKLANQPSSLGRRTIMSNICLERQKGVNSSEYTVVSLIFCLYLNIQSLYSTLYLQYFLNIRQNSSAILSRQGVADNPCTANTLFRNTFAQAHGILLYKKSALPMLFMAVVIIPRLTLQARNHAFFIAGSDV